MRNGIGLSNQKLVRKWVDSICGLTEEMVGWGLDLIRDGNGYHQIPWEGHTYPRMVNHHRVTGKYLMKCLGERSERSASGASPHSIVGGLFKTDGAVTGAWAVNYRNGEIYLIRCQVRDHVHGRLRRDVPDRRQCRRRDGRRLRARLRERRRG